MKAMQAHNAKVTSEQTNKLINQLQGEVGALGAVGVLIGSLAVMYASQVKGYLDMPHEEYVAMVNGFAQRLALTCRDMTEEERLKRVEVKGVA